MPVWKKVKEYIPGQTTDTKEYFTVWRQALDNKDVSNVGALTECGYGLYLSLLGVTGKTSIYNTPERKQYIWFMSASDLIKQRLIIFDQVNYEYVLTSLGQVYLEVLARCLVGKGTPRI